MEGWPTVIDIFAGAGGFSEGFFRNGYRFISHIEKDTYAAMTLKTREIYYTLRYNGLEDIYYNYLNGEISREVLINEVRMLLDSDTVLTAEISPENEKKIIRNIRKKMKIGDIKNVDVIIGGPPCQSYSVVGRNRDPNKMERDPRNYLYLHYLSFLKQFKPHIFVFENVPGIKTARGGEIYRDILGKLQKLGYNVEGSILDSSDFFVLQKRRRVILIGWKSEYNLEYPSFSPVEHDYTVYSLLNDLPPLNPGEGTDGPQEYISTPSEYLKKSGIRTDKDILIQHRAREHNERDREIYRYVINVWNNEHRRVKYDELPEHLKTHRNRTSFEDRFKVVAPELQYVQCITAHLSRDGHYFIHPDINQARSITVREAARIQSFPDNYKFEGPRTSQYIQVGNAVPPLMAEKIAYAVKKMMEVL